MRISTLAPVLAVATLWPMAPAAAAAPTETPARTGAAAGDAHGEGGLSAIGLTHDQRLVTFHTGAPAAARSLGRVDGLEKDTKLVGIDFRVQNGKLYGVGDQGGIYTLDTHSAQAKKVSRLTVELEGEYFGVDFNPAADRLRVISDTGQNLRHNIDDKAAPTTTTVDGTLTNPATPPSTERPTAKGVTGAAYTNNDLAAGTATTLFDVDTTNDRVSLQSPANAGSLAPTGGLGVKAGPSAGFDIHYDPNTGTNHGYATLHVDGAAGLYRVDVLTGAATSKGAFPAKLQVTDLALNLAQARHPQGAMEAGVGTTASNGGPNISTAGVAAGSALFLAALAGAGIWRTRRTSGTSAS